MIVLSHHLILLWTKDGIWAVVLYLSDTKSANNLVFSGQPDPLIASEPGVYLTPLPSLSAVLSSFKTNKSKKITPGDIKRVVLLALFKLKCVLLTKAKSVFWFTLKLVVYLADRTSSIFRNGLNCQNLAKKLNVKNPRNSHGVHLLTEHCEWYSSNFPKWNPYCTLEISILQWWTGRTALYDVIYSLSFLFRREEQSFQNLENLTGKCKMFEDQLGTSILSQIYYYFYCFHFRSKSWYYLFGNR